MPKTIYKYVKVHFEDRDTQGLHGALWVEWGRPVVQYVIGDLSLGGVLSRVVDRAWQLYHVGARITGASYTNDEPPEPDMIVPFDAVGQ